MTVQISYVRKSTAITKFSRRFPGTKGETCEKFLSGSL